MNVESVGIIGYGRIYCGKQEGWTQWWWNITISCDAQTHKLRKPPHLVSQIVILWGCEKTLQHRQIY